MKSQNSLSETKARSLLLGVDHKAIRTILEAFNQYFVPIIDQLNDAIVVGGCSADVELGEISFRSTGRAHGIVWLRYLAVARRGSSLVWLKRLGYRITRKGQGGGGHFCGRNVVRSTFAL